MTLLRRIRTPAAAFAAGILVGAAGISIQAVRGGIAGHQVWWGLALCLVMIAVGVRAAVWWGRSRITGAAAAVGWLLCTVVLSRDGRGGDVLLPDIGRSRIYLYGGVIIALIAMLVPLPRPDDAGDPDDPATAIDSGVVDPTVVDPTVVDPTVVDPTAVDPTGVTTAAAEAHAVTPVPPSAGAGSGR